jgi:type II secretory pathway pseudopilin PulG
MRRATSQGGFTYVAVLVAVALIGIMLAAAGMSWSMAQQRAKERELLFVGNAFRKAVADYYQGTPGTIKRYPNSFADLLKDNRNAATVRHLRRVYVDPMTGLANWGMVRAADGGIQGVYSVAVGEPVKTSRFRQRDSEFEGARSYADWRFVYVPPAPAQPGAL